jgi:hypothetical protein
MANRYWVGGTATWDATALLKWSLTSGGLGGEAVPTAADDVYFDAASGAVTITLSGARTCLSFNSTGFTGTVAGTGTITISGNATYGSGTTFTNTGTWTFNATSGIQQVTSNGQTLSFSMTQNGVGGTVQLQDNLTIGSARTYTLTNGALDLNNQTLSTGLFASSNSNVRSIAFGTGKIQLTGNSAAIWGQNQGTNFSYTGTSRIECTYSGSTGTRSLNTFRTNSGGTEANSLNFYVTAGSDTFSFSTTSCLAKTLDFTGFSGSFTPNACFLFGDLIISSGMSLNTSATLGIGFLGSSTQAVTTAGKTFDFPLTFGTSTFSSNVVFQDALTQGSTRNFTITNGTVQLKNGVTSTVGSFVATSSNVKFLQSTTPGSQATLSQASGTVYVVDLTIRDINAVGGASWNAYTDFENTDAGNNDGWNFSLSPPYSTAELPVTLRPFTQPRRF